MASTTLEGQICHGPHLLGEAGTNQAFFSLIHQNPSDLTFHGRLEPLGKHHDLLMANLFARPALALQTLET